MKEHRFERQVRMLVEKVEHDVDIIVASFREGERTAFTVPSDMFGKVPSLQVKFNELEQYERWLDPMQRVTILEEMLADVGPEKFPDMRAKYEARMAELAAKAQEANNA